VSEIEKPGAGSFEVRLSRPLLAAGVDRGGHLGFVAHELRNPMSSAIWSAQLLTRFGPEERAGERGLKLAALGARAMGRVQVLLEDHLLCERLDAGGFPLRFGPVEVAALLAAAVGRLEPQPTPEVVVAPGLAVRGDRTLLERALEGVVAVAGRGGVPVRIAGAPHGELVHLVVRGAPVERLEDPAKGSPSDPEGRALSLPMARRVAEVHGGALTVEGGAYLLVFPGT
jgi:K+-sensing histidine kinase KdpD